jgi:hypothetical protein
MTVSRGITDFPGEFRTYPKDAEGRIRSRGVVRPLQVAREIAHTPFRTFFAK